MNLDHARFAALISSRLCHDIVSPATNLSLSLEMLDGPGSPEEKMNNEAGVREGAEGIAVKLQFLRYAFGSMGLQSGTADLHNIQKLINDYIRTQKPSVEWDLAVPELSFGQARLIMNMVMVGLTATVRGGVITIRVRNESGGKSVILTCKGERIKLKDDVARAVRGLEPEGGWGPENIQPLFAKMTCDALGGELTITQGPDAVIVMATGLRDNP